MSPTALTSLAARIRHLADEAHALAGEERDAQGDDEVRRHVFLRGVSRRLHWEASVVEGWVEERERT